MYNNNKLTYSSSSGSESELELKDWDPVTSQRIRILLLDMQFNPNFCHTPNMNIHQNLMNQIFPYITTLNILNLDNDSNTDTLFNFIQNFHKLKNISLSIYRAKEQSLNYFKSILSKLNLSGIEIELRLSDFKLDQTETTLLIAPENGITTAIHRLGFDDPEIKREEELQRFAQLITENQPIIWDIHLVLEDWNLAQMNENNAGNILNHLRAISPFVCTLKCSTSRILFDIDFFNNIYWPMLITLELLDYRKQLPDLSIYCPNLQSLTIEAIEHEAFFSNPDSTHEQDLKHIFHGCTKSLEKLKIIHSWRKEYDKKFRRNSHMHKYLQKLLPHITVEIVTE